jgi:hypothetical protein
MEFLFAFSLISPGRQGDRRAGGDNARVATIIQVDYGAFALPLPAR